MDLSTFLLGVSAALLLAALSGIFGPWLLLLPLRPKSAFALCEIPYQGTLTVVIPLHDHAGPLERKISALADQLSQGRDEIIIALDGPVILPPMYRQTGAEHPEIATVTGKMSGIKLKIIQLPKAGKNAALNAAGAAAKGDVIIVTDRDAIVPDGALQKLVAPLGDNSVGAVCGHLVLEGQAGEGQRGYWNLEAQLKELETLRLGSITASNGSLLAVRKQLFPVFPHGVADDIFAALHVKRCGFRCVYAAGAPAFSPPRRKTPGEVMQRQRRIVGGGLLALYHQRELMNPFRHGVYAPILACHKGMRRLVPMLAATSCITAAAALPAFPALPVLTLLALAGGGAVFLVTKPFKNRTPRNKMVRRALWLCAAALGMSAGVFDFFRGKKTALWK